MNKADQKHKLAGFITDQEHIRSLRKKRPKAYAALKNANPRTCVAWNTLDRRAKLGFSQAELAEKSGISRRSIQYLEDITSHFSPSLDALEKVAKALKLEVTDLFKPVDMTKPDVDHGVKAVYASAEKKVTAVRETKASYRTKSK